MNLFVGFDQAWLQEWIVILMAAGIVYALRIAGVHLAVRLPPGGTIDLVLQALAPSLFAALISVTLASASRSSLLGAGLCLLLLTRLPALFSLIAATVFVAGLRGLLPML